MYEQYELEDILNNYLTNQNQFIRKQTTYYLYKLDEILDKYFSKYIARLDGTLITSSSYEPITKKDTEDSLNSSIDSQGDASIDQKSQQQIGQMKLNDAVKSVINHSRTLSLSLYEHELIYCKFQGNSFYYRAKYNLLFIFVQQSKEYLDMTVDSIDRVIFKVIKQYQQTCENIRCNYKLPRTLTKYQKGCLQGISEEIIETIIDEKTKDLGMPQLERQESFKQQSIAVEMKHIIEQLATIQSKNRKIQRQPSLFERYTLRNVNRYKLKLCFLIIMVTFMVITGILIIIFKSPSQILL